MVQGLLLLCFNHLQRTTRACVFGMVYIWLSQETVQMSFPTNKVGHIWLSDLRWPSLLWEHTVSDHSVPSHFPCLLANQSKSHTVKTVCPYSENKEGTFILCYMNSINENWQILFSLDTGLCVYAHAYVRFKQPHTQGCQSLYRLGKECHQSTWKFLKSFQIKLCLILDSLLLNILVLSV